MNIKNSKPLNRSTNNEKSLRLKLSDLELKYHEFVNHCSNYIQSPSSPKRSKQSPIVKKTNQRGLSSDINKENHKLRRQIELLTKTIQELNQRVSSQDQVLDDYKSSKDLERILKTKSLLLEKQETEMIQLKREMEIMRTEIHSSKNVTSEREQRPKSGSSHNTKNSKSPLSQRWVPKNRDFSPINRKESISPINRTISPKDRLNHSLKTKVKTLEEKAEKLKEERDMYKVLQQVSSENPPVSPSIESLVSYYEKELETTNALNTLLKGNLDRLSKLSKEFINESSRTSVEKSKQAETLEGLKRKIFDAILNSMDLKNKVTPKSPRKLNDENVNQLRLSQKKLLKEYEDLGKIVKREQTNSDIALFELNLKTAEINELKNTIESHKFISSSAQVTTENFFDSRGFNKNLASTFSFGNEDLAKRFAESCESDSWKNELLEYESKISAEFKKVLMKIDFFQDKYEERLKKFGSFVRLAQNWKKNAGKFERENKETAEKLRIAQSSVDGLKAKLISAEEGKLQLTRLGRLCSEYEMKLESKANELKEHQKKAFQLETCEKELNDALDEIKRLSIALKRQEAQINSLTSVIATQPTAKKELETRREFSQSFPASGNHVEQTLQCLIRSLNQMLSKNFNLETLQEVPLFILEKDQKIADLQKSLQSNTLKSDKKQEKIKQLSDSLMTKDKQLQEIKEKLRVSSTEQSSKNEELLKSLSESQNSLEILQKQSEDNLLQASSKSSEIVKLTKDLESLQEEFTNLQTFFDSLYNEKIELLEEINSLKITETDLKQRLLDEQVFSQEKEHEIGILTKTLDNLREENRSRKLSEDNLKNEKNNEIDFLRTENKNLEDEVSRLKNKLDTLNANLVVSLETKIQDMNELLEKREEEFEELLQQKISEVEKLRVENEKLSENFRTLETALKEKPQKSVSSERGDQTDDSGYRPRSISLDAKHFDESDKPDQIKNLLSPHNLMRTESLEQMPEIVLGEESNSNRSGSGLTGEHLQHHLLARLQETMTDQPSESVVNWCKLVLGSANYIKRYVSNDSVYSEESKSNFDDISVASEVSQEANYRAHSKLMQQKKVIENLASKVRDKKEKVKLCKMNIKTLQNEIRNLDNKLKDSGSIDIEYLKTSISSFSKNIKKIDNDSLKTLHIIQSHLGIKFENVSQKKWTFFK